MRVLFFVIIFLVNTTFTVAQVTVSGVVTSKDDRSPLPGVNVMIQGIGVGTATDQDGKFSLTVNDLHVTLVFSFVGMKSKDVALNGRDYVVVAMGPECHRDWFDAQEISIAAVSGVLNTPVGAQLGFSLPAFFRQSTLKNIVSLQSNLDQNTFLNAMVRLDHLAVTCNFDMDVYWHNRKVSLEDNFRTRAYSFQGDLNFSNTFYPVRYVRVIVGFGSLTAEDPEHTTRSAGPTVGLGAWIGGSIRSIVSGQISFYRNSSEYRCELARRFKKVNAFARYYKLQTFDEFSIGIGTNFTYRFKSQRH